jgi:hypothetical protein
MLYYRVWALHIHSVELVHKRVPMAVQQDHGAGLDTPREGNFAPNIGLGHLQVWSYSALKVPGPCFPSSVRASGPLVVNLYLGLEMRGTGCPTPLGGETWANA